MKQWQLIQSRLENGHVFLGSGYTCAICDKPRALHLNDAFVPGNPPSTICMDPSIAYKRVKPRNKRMFGNNCFEKQKALDAKNLRATAQKIEHPDQQGRVRPG